MIWLLLLRKWVASGLSLPSWGSKCSVADKQGRARTIKEKAKAMSKSTEMLLEQLAQAVDRLRIIQAAERLLKGRSPVST